MLPRMISVCKISICGLKYENLLKNINSISSIVCYNKKLIHTNKLLYNQKKPQEQRPYGSQKESVDNDNLKNAVTIFDSINNDKKNKKKDTFLDILHMYTNEPDRKTGHVQFVYAAMKYMDEFGVNEDMEIYKAILNTMPKGRYAARTLLQAEFMHYPREQQCIIDLLDKMEANGICPDPELELMIINIFGQHAIPLRKLRRMAYWMGKFKNLNPWPTPKPLPTEALDLAEIAIKKIASVDVQSHITIFDTNNINDSIDKTWIVSASSPDQERLIKQHPKNIPIYVEGPFRIWVSKASVDYFTLHADPLKKFEEEDVDIDDMTNIEVNFWKSKKKALAVQRCIHEQNEQTIFSVCATGTSSKDSLLSWIRCLQKRNPDLENIPILFKFTRKIDDFEKITDGSSDDNTDKVDGDNSEKISS